jgi:hypothetical protein
LDGSGHEQASLRRQGFPLARPVPRNCPSATTSRPRRRSMS